MKYIAVYLTGADFSAFGNDSSRFSAYFADFISRPAEPLLWGAVFLLLCIYVVVRGVSEGIERVSKFLMPGLFVLLTGIVVYAVTLDGAAEGLNICWQWTQRNSTAEPWWPPWARPSSPSVWEWASW